MLRAEEMTGVYAIIPTPAKEGSSHWSAKDTVDVNETIRMVNKLVADGVGGLIALGTTGECATLTPNEFRTFADAVVRAVDGRIPTFIGATTLGTHETIDRLEFIHQLGATGTLLGLPMWQPCTEDMAVRFYKDVSEALPSLSVMVYMNVRAFRFDFPVSFWERVLQEAPTITSAKFGAPNTYVECLKATKGRVKLLPIDMAALTFSELAPGSVTACWATAASMGPQPSIALMKSMAAEDWERAKAIDADIKWANETFLPPDPAEFGHLNIQLEKLRMAGAGYCNPGPIRPPYDLVSAEYEGRAREVGRRWAELVKKYSG